ncbi:MAG TPA: TraB/GumN family protein [Candidatus Thalassarchaeaceae archaeon]|jgi:pheromone shutdown-related protein TraB|nr:TraB/GumN family protein [Candidatus Thalassarchaeaceae archaeon]HJM67965.1 TraB/GumN family protein [Candidatus Thalassarchaeaceae archaeon]
MTIVDIDDNLRLLGTAHISKASADAARREVSEYEPDIVAIELCKSRLDALSRPERFDNETLGKVLREGKAPLVLFQSMLAVEQRRMGLAEGEKPGTDLLAAMQAASEAQKEVALVDRDIQTTLRRAWRRMRFREKWRVMSALLFQEEEDEEIQVDELLENTDLITELMGELRDVAPAAGEVLIDERDEFLASSIQQLRPEGKVLAVIGAGHLEGVAAHLRNNIEVDKERLRELNRVEPPHRAWKGVKWGIPVLMLGLFAWMASQGDMAALKEAAITWLALNAVLAALGAAIARGHPLSILTAAIASPITSLNPMLAAGWFAGLVQLNVAAPSTKDLQAFLKLDQLSLFWKNKVGRVLLVTAFANLGSTAGAWIAGSAIIGSLL